MKRLRNAKKRKKSTYTRSTRMRVTWDLDWPVNTCLLLTFWISVLDASVHTYLLSLLF